MLVSSMPLLLLHYIYVYMLHYICYITAYFEFSVTHIPGRMSHTPFCSINTWMNIWYKYIQERDKLFELFFVMSCHTMIQTELKR